MVPHIAKAGRSFKGAGLYYLHDKGALTSERVAFTHGENLHSQNAERALTEMAFVALNADRLKEQAGVEKVGRKGEYPVYHYSLSWHPDQQPSREDMIEAGRSSLKALELEGYQAMMIAHNDEPHAHLHILVNRVHPDTGKMVNIDFDKMRLSRWAEAYEKEHSHIYCPQRVENNARREKGEYVQYHDPVIAVAWRRSDSGKAFASALMEQGYAICRGERRDFVVMDPNGKIHNPARHIDGAKVADIRARLKDLGPAQIFSIEEARERQRARQEAQYAQEQARRNAPVYKVTGTAYARDPRRDAFQHELKGKHEAERAALQKRHAQERARIEETLRQGHRIDRHRAELAAIEEQRQKAHGFKAILRQLKGQDARDRAQAELLKQAIAQGEQIVEKRLKDLTTRQERETFQMELRHEAEKQGRFTYERVVAPLPGRSTRRSAERERFSEPEEHARGAVSKPQEPEPERKPELHARPRPRMRPGYGRPTLGEKLADIQNRRPTPDPPAPIRTPTPTPPDSTTIREPFDDASGVLRPPKPEKSPKPVKEAFKDARDDKTTAEQIAEWARGMRQALDNRQAADRQKLARELAPEFAQRRQAVESAHAPRLSTVQREIAAIEARQARPGLRGQWERSRHGERLEALREELETAEAAREEALEALERQKAEHERVRALREWQERERQSEEERIARQVDSGQLPPEAANENGRERGEERERDTVHVPSGHSHGRGGRSREH